MQPAGWRGVAGTVGQVAWTVGSAAGGQVRAGCAQEERGAPGRSGGPVISAPASPGLLFRPCLSIDSSSQSIPQQPREVFPVLHIPSSLPPPARPARDSRAAQDEGPRPQLSRASQPEGLPRSRGSVCGQGRPEQVTLNSGQQRGVQDPAVLSFLTSILSPCLFWPP